MHFRSECSTLGELLVHAYDTIPGAQVDPDYNAVLRDVEARARSSRVFVAIDNDGTLLGGLTFVEGAGQLAPLAGSTEAEIRMFAVSNEARGRGVGRELIRHCIAVARQEGLEILWLSTSPWMTAAQQLYESLGFRRVPERDRTEQSSGMAFHLLAYSLDLRSA